MTALTFFSNNKQGLGREQEARTRIQECIITRSLQRVKQSILLNAAAQSGVFLVHHEGERRLPCGELTRSQAVLMSDFQAKAKKAVSSPAD